MVERHEGEDVDEEDHDRHVGSAVGKVTVVEAAVHDQVSAGGGGEQHPEGDEHHHVKDEGHDAELEAGVGARIGLPAGGGGGPCRWSHCQAGL